MYREVQHIRDNVAGVQREVNAGILAESTRDITAHTSQAMALIDGLIQSLNNLNRSGNNEGVEPQLVDATGRALNRAWVQAERVAIGSSVAEMRQALVDCKTFVDYAEAFVSASLGVELEQ